MPPINGAQPNLDPETSETYEAGAKLSFFDSRLGLTGGLFQVTKSNATYTDPTTGDAVATGERQRVRGFELGVTGQITDAWNVNVAYSYLQSKVLTGASAGNRVGGVPANAVSLWTTYNLSTLLPTLSGKLTVGGGIVYRSAIYTASNNTYRVPETFSVDALLSYEFDNYRIAINGYNLTNNLNYGSFFNNRAIPPAGRAVTVTASVKF